MAGEAEESPELPEDLVAVCLDANAMSRGRLNLDAVADLLEVIEDQDLDVEVWVPEPVLWEWAEHLASDLATVRAQYEGVRAQATSAGAGALVVDAWDTPVDVDRVVVALDAALEDLEGASVLRLRNFPGAAADGLRDQILLRGAGRKKKEIKTGAADSTAFRLAESELERGSGSMVVVSGDQDATHHFSGNDRVLVVNSLSRAKAGILGMRPGSEVARERVVRAIEARLPQFTKLELSDRDIDGDPAGIKPDSRLRGRIIDVATALVSIDGVLAVEDVEVSRSDGYAAAQVVAHVSVERALQVLSEVNAMVEIDVETFDGVEAVIEVSAESDDGIDWELVIDKVHLV